VSDQETPAAPVTLEDIAARLDQVEGALLVLADAVAALIGDGSLEGRFQRLKDRAAAKAVRRQLGGGGR
jgi:hypothetical protein